MAFQPRNLSVLAYANGFTLWHYTTDDEAANLGKAGYFDPAAEMLRAGDVMVANAGGESRGVPSDVVILAISDSRESGVAVAPVAATPQAEAA